MSKVKTQREFREYFEKYYTRNNPNPIDFKDKIIVFEDIDCMSNIVKKRETKQSNDCNKSDNSSDSEYNDSTMEKTLVLQNKLLNKIAKKVDEDHEDTMVVDFDKNKDDKITLSFILNIIDEYETPGRILIITSNNYSSLDDALIRPGRIDMTLEMKMRQ